ncbi:MAG: putative maltokinase [Chloroflexia bacterium]
MRKHIHNLFSDQNKTAFEAALPDYLPARRWFGGKARTISSVELADALPITVADSEAYITILRVNYADNTYQHYVLPVSISDQPNPQGLITTLDDLTLYDATFNPDFTLGLLSSIQNHNRYGGPSGEIAASHTPALEALDPTSIDTLTPSIMGAEQSNTSVKYGDSLVLKLFRRLEEGISPDLELGRFLGEQHYANTPPLYGALEYYTPSNPEPLTLAILQGFVPNKGDAWSFTLETVADYFNRGVAPALPPKAHILDLANADMPDEVEASIGEYTHWARLLGRRTAEMHIALAANPDNPAFAPEPYTPDYQRAMHDAMSSLVTQAFNLLRPRASALPAQAQDEATALIAREADVQNRFQPLLDRPIQAVKTRVHGDYHLGQVLFTGDDFMIIDFEGEPVRSLAERKLKHSPLKDVAGMLRSFHYAAYSGLFDHQKNGGAESAATLEQMADAWQLWVSAAYLREYLQTAGDAPFLPRTRDDLEVVMDAYLLEKAVYELIYELNNRPNWVMIPLKGILYLIN